MGQKRVYFSLVKDKCILTELVIPGLGSQKLSEVFLSQGSSEVLDLSRQWSRCRVSVMTRWMNNLQPLLLQHYSGTLNLRVERMLASHIAESYSNFSEIKWSSVAARSEFAGHTERSLRNMYFFIYKHTMNCLEMKKSDLNPQHIARYC